MFNDNVSMGYFDVYDQYLLNLLYDPRIKAGMTVQDVKAFCRKCSATCVCGCARSTIWPSEIPSRSFTLTSVDLPHPSRHRRDDGRVPGESGRDGPDCQNRAMPWNGLRVRLSGKRLWRQSLKR